MLINFWLWLEVLIALYQHIQLVHVCDEHESECNANQQTFSLVNIQGNVECTLIDHAILMIIVTIIIGIATLNLVIEAKIPKLPQIKSLSNVLHIYGTYLCFGGSTVATVIRLHITVLVHQSSKSNFLVSSSYC